MFPPNSRYHKTKIREGTSPDGRVLVFLNRRFLPELKSIQAPIEHNLVQNDRLDNISADYLGDPELFWVVCDANVCLHPDELIADIVSTIRIPLVSGG